MKFGISDESADLIKMALSRWREIDKATVFGSRAMGNYKHGSDFDLAIYGKDVTEEIIDQLSVLLNQELPLPYYFDVVHYETLENEQLRAHIDNHGQLLYCPNPRRS